MRIGRRRARRTAVADGAATAAEAAAVPTGITPLIGDFDGDRRSDVFMYGPGSARPRRWAGHASTGQGQVGDILRLARSAPGAATPYELFLAAACRPCGRRPSSGRSVPPCLELPPLPEALPPFLEASGVLAILAARSLDMPLSSSASYCLVFLTLADFDGIRPSLRWER